MLFCLHRYVLIQVKTKEKPAIIEVSDDSSDSADLTILQSVEPKTHQKTDQVQSNIQYDNFLCSISNKISRY